MNKVQIRKILGDIRFWIILLFVLRLVGITNAPLEVSHNWRQSLTNMVARNFLENGANLLYPTIDMAGEKTGIIGSEFPFFNYLIYLFTYLFDYSHWPGRLINLAVSSFGLYYFYKLIKGLITKEVAFNATLVLSVSIWFAFSRKIMPDTFSVSLMIIGLYHVFCYLKTGAKTRLLYFFLFSTLGMLCKIPALSLFSILFILLFIKELDARRKIAIYATGTVAFSIVCVWYFYWVPYLLETYQYQLYFPKGFSEGINEIAPLIPELLERFYFSALHSFIALACCIAGIVFLIKKKQKRVLFGIGVITAVFILFIIKTGAVFPRHSYYIIPFAPVMALIAGYGIAQLSFKFQYILLVLIAVEGIANQQDDFRIKDSQLYKLGLENITEKLIPEDDLIIINGGPSPQDIYYSHRKGWTVENTSLMNAQYIDSLSNWGAKYLVLDITNFDHQFNQYKNIYSDEHYSIYALDKTQE